MNRPIFSTDHIVSIAPRELSFWISKLIDLVYRKIGPYPGRSDSIGGAIMKCERRQFHSPDFGFESRVGTSCVILVKNPVMLVAAGYALRANGAA
jgi:hypothetical protein